MKIYDYILPKIPLLTQHKKSLKYKRGFTPETIDTFQLKSCGDHFKELLLDLQSQFTSEELHKSGILYDNKLNNQLTTNNVLIPYLDKNNQCYVLRPHKMGFKGHGVSIFSEQTIKDNEKLIITEGEFKAIAGYQYGYNIIAIPGIQSYSKDHYDTLVQFLKSHKINDIVIVFDHEIKDNPKYKNYKQDISKRYDSQFYAWWMAKTLKKSGFNSSVVILPEKWMVQGKIDIDGALSQERSKDEMDSVINADLTPKEYFKTFTDEQKRIILRKNRKKGLKTHIIKKYGKYWALRRFDGKEEQESKELEVEVSNFIMKVISTRETKDAVIREIVFENEFGEKTKPFFIDAGSMVNNEQFKKFVTSQGNFLWYGKTEDLNMIWLEQFLDDSGQRIIEQSVIGSIKDDFWLFGNLAIDGHKVILPDEKGIIWYNEVGYQPSPVVVERDNASVSDGIPILCTDVFKFPEMLKKLSDTVGPTYAKIIIGWVVAVVYMNEIIKEHKSFPFLFLAGKRGSGKSTIAEWIMYLFGLESSGKILSDTTEVAIAQLLSSFSCLPVWFDEYRNEKKITRKDGILRSTYNRQSSAKGRKYGQGLREVKVKGTVILSGQELPRDNALLTRCIPIIVHMDNKARKVNHMNWFVKMRNQLSYFTYWNLLNKDVNTFLETIEKGKDHLCENEIDDRTALNYSIVAAGYNMLFKNDIEFAESLVEMITQVKEDVDDEQILRIFWADLLHIKEENNTKLSNYIEESNGKIYIAFRSVYTIWTEHRKRVFSDEPFKEPTLRQYLQDEDYCLEISNLHRFGASENKQRRSIVLDSNKCSYEIKQLCI